MSNLLSANLPSEDEEDEDYVPDEVDEEERRLQKQKQQLGKKPKRVRGAAAGGDEGEDEGNSDGDEAGQAGGAAGDGLEDADDLLPDSKRLAKKAKVDALWSQLNRKPAAIAATAATKPSGGGASLASLCKPAGGRGKANADEVSRAATMSRGWAERSHVAGGRVVAGLPDDPHFVVPFRILGAGLDATARIGLQA